jgi:transketolase
LKPEALEASELLSRQIRGWLVEITHKKKTAHLASALSCVDILVAAYCGGTLKVEPSTANSPERDRIILSKGHAVGALYAILAYRGFFDEKLLDTWNEDGGKLPEHPSPGCVPGLELATGSLGHGLPCGLGMALGMRIKKLDSKVLVVLSDGECNEGSVWEAAMMAPAQKATNLAVIIDYNKWQATGRSDEVLSLHPLSEKWKAFGWYTLEVDGHNLTELQNAIEDAYRQKDKPTAIIAHTVKGKGVSFMEDDNNWHYRAPTADEVSLALLELGLA